MALSVGKNGAQVFGKDLFSLHHHHHQPQQLQPTSCTQHHHHHRHEEGNMSDGADSFWSRAESRIWTVMLLLGTSLLYCVRVTMPICVMAMSEHFDWDKKHSGIVLSSFFWGYCLTQIVGGHLSDRIGGEKVLLLSASAWGSITAITPLFLYFGSAQLLLMTISRFLMGLSQGVFFPALTSLLSQKVRESERGFTYSSVGTGSQFGMLVMGATGSLLLDWYGWESVFYFSGALTLLWVYCMWKYLLNEKEIIIPLGDLAKSLSLSKQIKVHWKQLFKKAPVWAVIIAQLSAAGAFFTLFSWLPTFFEDTFPDSKLGIAVLWGVFCAVTFLELQEEIVFRGWIFNVVPWLVAIPMSLFSGFLSDQCISQGYKAINVRKFMQVMGLGASSVFALCIGRASSFCKAVMFASACIGLQTFNHSGISVNIQDLAPSCAGLLFGVANTGGALLGVVCVYLAGHLIESSGSWTSVFNLVATVNLFGLCTFLIFGKAQRMDMDYMDL